MKKNNVEKKNNPYPSVIARGVKMGMDERMIESARKYLETNGYSNSYGGKIVACSDIAQRIEDPLESTALQTSIMMA